LLSACDSGASLDPSGDYQVRGETVQQEQLYSGVLRVARNGPGYHLTWLLGQHEMYHGTALYADNVLGAVYWFGPMPSPDMAVAIYRIEGGELNGTWLPAAEGPSKPGREVLTGSSSLAGRYEISVGENPDGSTYSGAVEMERRGRIYEMRWYMPGLTYVGRGVRLGDVLIVGYGSSIAPGVVGYCMTSENGKGVWSYGEAKGFGTEAISRGIKKDAFGSADIGSIESACKDLVERSLVVDAS
jgi:hypothetical protein